MYRKRCRFTVGHIASCLKLSCTHVNKSWLNWIYFWSWICTKWLQIFELWLSRPAAHRILIQIKTISRSLQLCTHYTSCSNASGHIHTHTLPQSIAHAHGLSVTHTNTHTHTQDLYTSQPSTFMYILHKWLWEKLATEMQKHIVHKAVEQGTKIFACSDNTRSTTFALHTSFPRPNSGTVTPITDKELYNWRERERVISCDVFVVFCMTYIH